MIDYEALFNEMLAKENGEKEVSKYLDEVAAAANRAIDKKKINATRKLVLDGITEMVEEGFGNTPIFQIDDSFTPRDAAEAFIDAINCMNEIVKENPKAMTEMIQSILE